MKIKKYFSCIVFLVLTLFIKNITIINANYTEQHKLEKIYFENNLYKAVYNENIDLDNLLNKNYIKIYNKSTNEYLKNEYFTNIIQLNNENLLVGKYFNGKYNYYELDKDFNLNLLVTLDYYIHSIEKTSQSYIILKKVNNVLAMGILDKEFKVIYEPMFKFKNIKFKNNVEILTTLNEKTGLFNINGNVEIKPIFNNLEYLNDTLIKATYKDNFYILEKFDFGYKNITSLKYVDLWAKDLVLKCIKIGIVPDELQLNFKSNISRQQFVELIINLYELKTNIKIDISNIKMPFLDTKNESVLKAYKLGLVSGKTNNLFLPNDFITREEVAVILSNLIKSLGIKTKNFNINYNDNENISSWAFNAIKDVSSINIMVGNENYFNPKKFMTIQEVLIAIYRLY